MVEDVILMYDKEEVLPHILKAFNNPCKYVIYWCIQIASITALAQLAFNDIKTYDVIDVLKKEIEIVFDEEVKEFAEEVLEDILESSK